MFQSGRLYKMDGRALLLRLFLLISIAIPQIQRSGICLSGAEISGLSNMEQGPLAKFPNTKSVSITLHAYSGTTESPQSGTFSFKSLNLTLQEIKEFIYKYHTKQCWDLFTEQMANISKPDWCDWKTIRRPYSHLRKCLENGADKLELNYPNSMAEEYIIISHHNYFINCTLQNQPLQDPPENILLALIITPICLIPFLVALVVLKSKGGEMQLRCPR
ncbi:receptor activity-modifying protein 2 [Pantherophis guttatus]|uniref:Receptor activity-modifying protein 2 n=1 Tax=Pantherophis guttatus TaxID=94885 RepID=A0A6P9BWD5_PANGU|nr:receptor activity-modifying protein 2 [Pantherophis guttatus]XP_034272087.1 receptor activity-modifying protein 2 [Pantherophis guttatus]